jgi:hypothetical protein
VTRRFAKKTAQNEAFLNRIFTQTNYWPKFGNL